MILGFGQLPVLPTVFFREKQPLTDTTYTLDLSPYLDDGEFPIAVSFAISPSGSGEAVPVLVSVDDVIATVRISGGVPGRNYIDELIIETSEQNIYQVLVGQVCSPILAGFPVPPPPNPGFGTPVVWNYTPEFDFTQPLNSGYIALVGGF